ncbi:tRNA (N6-threonylcarbamoyladenosine(37)-N6)-methyltransferase TrmO [candidate division GN15 bacterium]|nr:tRNA (N6-threonylcarbamoyladenosine(37)-N6)-methyltransferase TrmO [candidate division GN15 bacterium]
MSYRPIGIIHTPFATPKATPIQPKYAEGAKGRVVLDQAYAEGLADVDGFSHITLVYHLHRSEGYKLKVVPYLDTEERGLFATRAPRRPNAIGISVVVLERVEGNVLHIANVDMLDGTPLLDIKPYVEGFVGDTPVHTGWIGRVSHERAEGRADDRFHKEDD